MYKNKLFPHLILLCHILFCPFETKSAERAHFGPIAIKLDNASFSESVKQISDTTGVKINMGSNIQPRIININKIFCNSVEAIDYIFKDYNKILFYHEEILTEVRVIDHKKTTLNKNSTNNTNKIQKKRVNKDLSARLPLPSKIDGVFIEIEDNAIIAEHNNESVISSTTTLQAERPYIISQSTLNNNTVDNQPSINNTEGNPSIHFE